MAKTDTETPDLDNEARITLGLLNLVDEDSTASQRSLAGTLGIALGLANAYLKRCVKKGLIKIRQAPANRYAYYLTPKGFAEKSRLTGEFLSQSFNLFRHARVEGRDLFAHCEARRWNRVALYGAGDLTEIMTLSARDFAVQLVAVVADAPGLREFAGLPVVPRPDPAAMDAVIICDISEPQASYQKACAEFPPERVLAPPVLGVARRSKNDKGVRGGSR